MRTLVALGLVFGLVSAVAMRAQGPPPGMGGSDSPSIDVKKFGAEHELARLTKKYKLTEDEQGKIQPLLAEQEKQVHALGDDESLTDDEWVAGVRKVHRETVAKVKALMTGAQATKYVKDEEKQAKSDAEEDEDQGPGGGPGGGGPPPGGGGPGGE